MKNVLYVIVLLYSSIAYAQFPAPTPAARAFAHNFPKLANHIQQCCRSPYVESIFNQLHYYDLIVTSPTLSQNLPEYYGQTGLLRQRNKNIILLSYFSPADLNFAIPTAQNFALLNNFNNGLQPQHYSLAIDKSKINLYQMYPSNQWSYLSNINTDLNTYIPTYLQTHIMSKLTVDGIYYDWATTAVSWLNTANGNKPIDLNQDGIAETAAAVDTNWVNGYISLLINSRSTYPTGSIIMGNAGWNTGTQYASKINGIMIEQFLEGRPWDVQVENYAYYTFSAVGPRLSYIMMNSDNEADYKAMRLGLCSALMFDGYFCFTNRLLPSPQYQACRWYDEYSVDLADGVAKKDLKFKGYLGAPTSRAFEASSPANAEDRTKSLWAILIENRDWKKCFRRNFKNGIVLVNPTGQDITLTLEATYKRIKGTGDNDGSDVTTVVVPANSGLVLLRKS